MQGFVWGFQDFLPRASYIYGCNSVMCGLLSFVWKMHLKIIKLLHCFVEILYTIYNRNPTIRNPPSVSLSVVIPRARCVCFAYNLRSWVVQPLLSLRFISARTRRSLALCCTLVCAPYLLCARGSVNAVLLGHWNAVDWMAPCTLQTFYFIFFLCNRRKLHSAYDHREVWWWLRGIAKSWLRWNS